MPGREEFWNIGYPIFGVLINFAVGISVAMAGYTLWRRTRIWRLGAPVDDLPPWGNRVKTFSGYLLTDLLLHRKLIRHELYPGVMHLAIFWGFLILLVATILTGLEFYLERYADWTLPTVRYAAQTGFAWDAGGLLAIVGLKMAAYRRYVVRPSRIPTKLNAGLVIGFLLLLIATGYLVEGLRIGATELNPASELYDPASAAWSPVGWAVARSLVGVGATPATLESLHVLAWWLHAGVFLTGILYMAARFGRLTHIVISPVHVMLRQRRVRGALPGLSEPGTAGSTGISDLPDMTWRQLLSLDACTNCGRCEDQCPAWASGSPLSPRRVVQHLKRFMLERAPVLLGTPVGVIPPPPQETVLESMGGGAALWSCTMCAACVEACPVAINHVDLIAGIRRHQVLDESCLSPVPVLAPVRATGHASPGREKEGSSRSDAGPTRTGWTEGLAVRTFDDKQHADVLLWVGCSGALVERNMQVTRSLASVLRKAGVEFAVLGEQESCSGHTARRLGDEHLFRSLAERNIETLKSVSFKTIVTNCPGCFNTLKNEYPQFGGMFDVRHATEFVAELIDDGRITLSGSSGVPGRIGPIGKVSYHDSCSLGRYNGIYDAPRRIAKAIPGLELVEMAANRDRALCCGGGGGGQVLLEQGGQPVNVRVTRQFLETSADTLAVSGPDCLLMCEEGLSSAGSPDGKSASDLVELLDRATV